MSWKTILVHLPDARRTEPLLAVALQLAGRLDAHLIALHVVPQPYVPVAPYGDAAGEIMERERQSLAEDADRVCDIVAAAGVGRMVQPELRRVDARWAPVAETVILHAHAADLVVLAGPEKGFSFDYRPRDVAEDVMMHCGRPVLMMPPAAAVGDGFPQRVLIAWNGSRESARAAFDALPLLRTAQEARILTINPHSWPDGADADAAGRLVSALERHGVPAISAWTLARGRSVGAELKSRVEELKADLLVMGGYGHTRLRETLFGGVTSEILAGLRVPVLMSH